LNRLGAEYVRQLLTQVGRAGKCLRPSRVSCAHVAVHGAGGGIEFVPESRRKVFIAYTEEEYRTAEKLYRALEDEGFDPWLDKKKLLPGQNWPRSIERTIETSDFFLACFSRRGVNKRGYFHSELRYALDCASRLPFGEIYFIPVRLDNCRVPAENIIGGKEGAGFKTAMKVLDRGRLHISAICVGVATRLIEDAVNFAAERKQFGKPIIEHQLIQAMLADSRAEMFAGRSMVLEAARSKDRGEKVSLDASCCKLFCSEMVGRVADRAVQIHGGAGYMADYAVERFYRDVRLFRIYEGTTQIQQIVIARELARQAGNS